MNWVRDASMYALIGRVGKHAWRHVCTGRHYDDDA